ncbi:MAG TPA: glycoside hydrolase family 65 protein [Solirubrobacteraceae bacterium]|nr:glycoside hydrolase family 65 protein [Solirubrobacteraceae bacterium]
MIEHPAFPVEPWKVRETDLHLDNLAQTESVFALGNGHIGLRGNLDEGEPHGIPGTYLGGFYETRPLPYAEAGYGYPEDGQTVVNVTNGKLIRLLVEDEPFDVRYGTLRKHERVLDLRDGVLRRMVEWTSPTGRTVRVRSTRMVSFTQRAVAVIEYVVEPVEDEFPVVVQSLLAANEPGPALTNDPRAAAALASPLESDLHGHTDRRAILVHHTRRSGLRVAAAIEHLVDGPEGTAVEAQTFPDNARFDVTADVAPGKPLRIVKLIAYGWSATRSVDALRDQVAAAGIGAKHTGWEGLLKAQRSYLDEFWERSDVEIEGDAELQQAIRFGLFHTLQAGARGEQRAIPAKGLTGPGYDGHTFWDTEMFVLPVLAYTAPHACADALRWRHQTLDLARERARTLNLKGAAFPWRTIHGEECSSYWPAGTAAFHINADIARAVILYQMVADDQEFEETVGTELLVETARLWRSLGHHDAAGGFRIDGVTGPDEYSAIADNNVYTNLMAQRNLIAAADAVERHPQCAATLGVDEEEAAGWRDAAAKMIIPYDEALGVHPQSEGFTEHQRWDFEHCAPETYPLLLHYPYFDLYRKQVVKQADLVYALFICGDSFTAEEKLRDFDYYEPLTVRDSSLSACCQAVVAAEVGHIELAYDYFAEAALMDLEDLEHNTRDGVHIASVAGTWIAAVCGFGGLRSYGDELHLSPRLPPELTRLKFRLMFRGSFLHVEVDAEHARYSLVDGHSLDVHHHGERVTVQPDETVEMPIPRLPSLPAPSQPPGRTPVRRRPPARQGSFDPVGQG